jgi:hypothetical protein
MTSDGHIDTELEVEAELLCGANHLLLASPVVCAILEAS